MAEMQKAPAKKSKPVNWTVLIVTGLGLAFIVGVWVNSYRVTHATPAITSNK